MYLFSSLAIRDCQKRKRALAEPPIRFHYMREGSLSIKRALGVATTSPRLNNNEGSTFQCFQKNDSVRSNESNSTVEVEDF